MKTLDFLMFYYNNIILLLFDKRIFENIIVLLF